MNQFEEITRKNRGIIKVIFSIPILIVILLLLAFLYFLPTLLKLSEIGETQEEILADSYITDQEARDYISRMETDEDTMNSFFLLHDQQYNMTLLILYGQTRDFDKIIARTAKISEIDDNPIYHFYTGIAYMRKSQFDNATAEMNKVLAFEMETSTNTEVGDLLSQPYLDKFKEAAGIFIDVIDIQKKTEGKDFSNSVSAQEASKYIALLERLSTVVDISGSIQENLMLLELYSINMDYEKIIDRAQLAIQVEDFPLYHYYLGFAYFEQSQKDLALTEFQKYLDGDSSEYPIFNTLDKTEYARTVLEKIYYDKGQFTDSLRYAKEIVSERVRLASDNNAGILREFNEVVNRRQNYIISVSDIDQDGLSDELENLLGLDKNSKDTDGDTFEDRQEFMFGYNPLKKSPGDIITEKEYSDLYYKIIASYSSNYNQSNQ